MASVRKRSWKSTDGLRSAWVVDYKDGGGKRRLKSFSTRKEASEFLITANWELRHGHHTPDRESISVERAADLWLQRAVLERLEPATIAAYEGIVRLHIVPIIGGQRLNQLTRPSVEAFRDKLLETRTLSTARKALETLSMILEVSLGKGLVTQNASRRVRIKRSGRRKRAVIPTKDELRNLLRVADAHPDPFFRAFAYVLIFTGLRASEIRGLTWSSINFRTGTITVFQRSDRHNTIGLCKSGAGFRTIPLGPCTAKVLEAWKNVCPGNDLDLVFADSSGAPFLHPTLLNKVLYPLQIAAGMSRMTVPRKAGVIPKRRGKYGMHNFRHAAASLWIAKGIDPKRIQIWMGHASIQITFDTYGHLFDEARADANDMRDIESDLGAARDMDATIGLHMP